jgi:tRNA-uridine 2-sulfurtransferase
MKIFVAMSGGVDSSVAAAHLKEQGHDVTGVTMRLMDVIPVESAQQAAETLGIPHLTIDLFDRFKSCVINRYKRTYATGQTPNPCVVCNSEIKFGALLDFALANGAERLATGHYARVIEAEGAEEETEVEVEIKPVSSLSPQSSPPPPRFRLLKGLDSKKDQSYFLYRLRQEQLRHIQFPLGGMTKDQVRAKAVELHLPQASQEESQDVCFATELKSSPGEIVDKSGRVIGTHNGISGFTVGQRKGLGVAAAEPLYVLEIDGKTNRVIVGERGEGYKTTVEIADIAWIAGRPPNPEFQAKAKIRYNSPESPADIKIEDTNSGTIIFNEPQFALAPGQSLVIYDGEAVLGGGIISKAY